MPDPTMVAVDSSNVRAVGYGEADKILVVEFKPSPKDPTQTRPKYRVSPVEPKLHAAFMAAESKGGFYQANFARNPAYVVERLV